MSELEDLDDEFTPTRSKKRGNFGTIVGYQRIKCSASGIKCGMPAIKKSGPFWYCRHHAPRGSEG